MHRTCVAILAAALLIVFAAPVSAQDEPSIDQIITDDGRFTILVASGEAAGLGGTLSDCDAGPFTAFAPTDDAITASLEAVGLEVGDVIGDLDLLTTILTYHVVEGTVLAADLVSGEVPTLQGENLTIDADNAVLNGSVNITATDLVACNGVVHVIDFVLFPPSVAEALSGGDGGDDNLAVTGAESGVLAIVGVSLVLLGAMLLGTGRRFVRTD